MIGHRGRAREAHLLLTLAALAAQEGAAIECIVVEQGPLPEMRDRLPGWVRYQHTPVAESAPYNRAWALNVGARLARAPLLIFHDNDMLVPRRYAAEHCRWLDAGFEVMNLKRLIFYLGQEPTEEILATGRLEGHDQPNQIMQNAQAGGSVAITAEALEAIGALDEGFSGWGGEDNEFWERACTRRVWPWGCRWSCGTLPSPRSARGRWPPGSSATGTSPSVRPAAGSRTSGPCPGGARRGPRASRRVTPLVSAVVGVRDGRGQLVPSLASILRQDVDLELIVVDDGSTDQTREDLQSLAQGDARVRLFRQEQLGLTAALHLGCSQARGTYIARQDCGDLSHAGRLKAQLALMAEPETVLASCWAEALGPEREFLYAITRPRDATAATRALREERLGLPHHGTAVFRADAYRRVGGYRPAFPVAQDWDLWLRLTDSTAGWKPTLPESLYEFEVALSSITSALGGPSSCAASNWPGPVRRRASSGAATRPCSPRPQPGGHRAPRPTAHAYFIGKCLLDRRDPRAPATCAGPCAEDTVSRAGGWPTARQPLSAGSARPESVSLSISACGPDLRSRGAARTPAAAGRAPRAGRRPAARDRPDLGSTIGHQRGPRGAGRWPERPRWVRKTSPSQCEAMNVAAHLARHRRDPVPRRRHRPPSPELLEAYRQAFPGDPGLVMANGQVLQPWNSAARPGVSRGRGLDFDFASSEPCDMLSAIGCNVAVRRQVFLDAGGMDENFTGANYRNDAELAYRMHSRTGRLVRFVPQASGAPPARRGWEPRLRPRDQLAAHRRLHRRLLFCPRSACRTAPGWGTSSADWCASR